MTNPGGCAAAFADRLYGSSRSSNAVVGLDPYLPSIIEQLDLDPLTAQHAEAAAQLIIEYNAMIIDCIADIVSVVKPQSAYYERFGSAGLRALETTAALARDAGLLVLLDAKRGDIPSTSRMYAEAIFTPDARGVPAYDAVTVSPYLGRDSLEPFVDEAQKNHGAVFVCVKTSNPGAVDIQELQVNGRTVADEVAALVRSLNEESHPDGYGPVGAVVGSTYPDDAVRMRKFLEHSLFLVPGVGAQAGDVSRLYQYFNTDGRGALVSASRSVLYPKREPGVTTVDGVRAAANELVALADGAAARARQGP
jgi:orotidine-5'-phosphate decarboxylase